MASGIPGTQLRRLVLGSGPVSKASGAITGDPTVSMFTIAGGEVLVTSLYMTVTTAITTNGGTLALQQNPTTGDTSTIVAATDLGTTDSAVGSTIGVAGFISDPATTGATFTRHFVKGGAALTDWVVTTGAIELVGASSANGAVTMYATWIPITSGATLVAS